MGLCKCPKRKVTNQFCFEHRVNVCEDCMVNNHSKCIVQSYVQWLQDSDYSPVCELCHNDLEVDECLRLICYHVFHWPCLDQYARQLPPNTAPAGYVCPTCHEGIFPKSNLVSPIVDKLKAVLSQVNWARVGLGLPLVDETPPVSSRSAPDGSNDDSKTAELTDSATRAVNATGKSDGGPWTPFPEWQQHENPSAAAPFTLITPGHSVVDVSSELSYPPLQYTSSIVSGFFSPKQMYDARDSDSLGSASFDHDENKYRRRSAMEWLSRWFKSMSKRQPQKLDPHRKLKRYTIIFLLVFIGMATIILIMWRIGRASADRDPFLDPNANPNIRVIEDVDT